MMNNAVLDYLLSQKRPEDARFFTVHLMQQLQANANPDDLLPLMQAAGMQAARGMSLPPCQTLTQLQDAINAYWSQLGWGVVALAEHPDHLVIEHMASPLESLLGRTHLEYGAAFLEGVYQEWFVELGAGESLQVRLAGIDPETCDLLFRLAR